MDLYLRAYVWYVHICTKLSIHWYMLAITKLIVLSVTCMASSLVFSA